MFSGKHRHLLHLHCVMPSAECNNVLYLLTPVSEESYKNVSDVKSQVFQSTRRVYELKENSIDTISSEVMKASNWSLFVCADSGEGNCLDREHATAA